MGFNSAFKGLMELYRSVQWFLLSQNGIQCISVVIYLLTYLLTYLYTYLLTYLVTPWGRVLLEKVTDFQLVKKFPAFYGTRRFITHFTSASHLSLPWSSSILSIPQNTTLPEYYTPSKPGSPKWSLSLRFSHQNAVYGLPLLKTFYMHRPSHSCRFYHPNNIGWGVQIINPLNPELIPSAICWHY